MSKALERILLLTGITILLLIGWSMAVRSGLVAESVLPRPESVFASFVLMLDSPRFWYNAGVTGQEAILGFALGCGFAILLGISVSLSRIMQRTIVPYVIALQMVPKVALAPLFVFWFGFGMTSKVFTAAMICFLPMFVNVVQGMNSVDRSHVEMLRAAGASKVQIMRRLQFPSTLPFLFSALQICVVLAIIGAVVGEYVGAQAGIGYQIMQYNTAMRLPEMFALLAVLALVGVTLYTVVGRVRDKYIFW